MDGTDNQDPILGIIVVNPNLDAITEAKVALQDYDAEIGKAIAGVVTAQTKSGTNSLHGSGFWFRRTDALQARDPFTQFAPNATTGRFIPSDKWNQYGGTIGGPILKNKLFFFGDYQGTKETTGVTNELTVPTLKAEQTCTAATGFCDLSDYLTSAIGGGGQIYLPNPGNAKGTTTSVAVPGNLIPVSMLSPQAVAILKLFPAPTTNTLLGNYIASGSGSYKQNSFDTRIDYTMSPNWSMLGRFSLAYFNLSGTPSLGDLGGIGFGPGPGLAGSSNVHNYSLGCRGYSRFQSQLPGGLPLWLVPLQPADCLSGTRMHNRQRPLVFRVLIFRATRLQTACPTSTLAETTSRATKPYLTLAMVLACNDAIVR